jgi:hypothetical protein
MLKVSVAREETTMADLQITLTAEQRTFLVGLLETAYKESLVEEHRTEAPTYREHVIHHGELIAELLGKLGKPPGK